MGILGGVIGLVFAITIGNHLSFALDFQSSRTLSLGKAGRGGALLNDTITLNPSMLGFQKTSSLSGTFNWASNSNVPDSNRLFNVSLIDGRNEYFSAGVSFTRRADLDFIHVALAKRIASAVSVGAHVKRFGTRSNSLAVSGNSITGYETGVSASFAAPPSVLGMPIQLGLTADNLLHKASNEQYVGPKQLGGGIKLNVQDKILLYGDFVENFSYVNGTYPSGGLGTELSMGGNVFLRGGLIGFREKGWSAGGGWIGPKFGVAYGYQTTRIEAQRDFQHAITMDVYM